MLKLNSALQVVDLAGNNAGYGACLVLADVVASSTTLYEICLHHNALTQQGIRALLRAALQRAGRAPAIMLQRASFVRAGESQLAMHKLDPVNPDGRYKLDLAQPAQRQVALDMLKCAAAVMLCLRDSHAPCCRLEGSCR